MNIGKTKNTFFPKDHWFVFKDDFKIIYMTMKHIFFITVMQIWADPPYTQNMQAA